MKYRLYIDEVGNSDLRSSMDPNHRYLSLTGVIFDLEYVEKIVFPLVESLKSKYFNSHPDEPVILHRKEIMNKKYPFECLRDPEVEQSFNNDLLKILRDLNYVVLTVIIDKLEHNQRYKTWKYDPYHYCLMVMMERYILWLQANNAVGDVIAESRGGKEDRRLKESFERVYLNGSNYICTDDFYKYLTSKQLKVKPKSNNIAGLQIADLIAHPSFRSSLCRKNNNSLPDNFGGKIAKILEDSKYYKSLDGKIDGWGRKFLP